MADVYATATATVTGTVSALLNTGIPTLASHLLRRDDDDDDDVNTSTLSEININLSFIFDWGNAPGTGPYFSANNIDAATQITTAALMGGACLIVFSMLRLRWPELYSHRLRLRHMRPSNIPRTLFGWFYPVITMSDRHVLETIGLDALLFLRAYRMFIYMFGMMSVFGMLVLYPVNFFWAKETDTTGLKHTIFDSPLARVESLSGRYSIAHVFLAYAFAAILFFYIDRFALHTITMRWHYLLLTRRSGTSRTLMVTHLPRELRSEVALRRFVAGMQVGQVEAVHVAPMSNRLDKALKDRANALQKLENAYAELLGNPCRARSYDPLLLKRLALTDTPEARALERQLLRRWARRRGTHSNKDKGDHKTRGKPVSRPLATIRAPGQPQTLWGKMWPFIRVDAIDHWRQQLFATDRQLHTAREAFYASEAGTVAFVTMRRPVDAHVLSQLSVHARPDTCKLRMAPEARSVVWTNAGKPFSKKMLRYIWGLLMTVALLLLWCVPVVLISTLISLRFLVTRAPGLANVVENNRFVRSLLSYTLPSLILTIFTTILPRLLWGFVLTGGDRTFATADKNMFIRHLYFLVIYIVVIFGMSGSVWSSVYDLFTDFGDFWSRLVLILPQMASWYVVYVMLYGAGYQVLKLLHLKSVCRFLFLQAKAHTPRDYMKAISPVFIDWGTFQPYTLLFFFIGVLYAHLQPLLLPMTVLYYIVGLFVMKYMCVYAWYFRQQTAGAIWPVVFRRLSLFVLLYQALTTAVFASNDNHWFVAPMVVLMLFTWYYFWVRCRYLRALAASPPLQLMREADRRREIGQAKEKQQQARETKCKPITAPIPDDIDPTHPPEQVCAQRIAAMTADHASADALHESRCDYNDQALVSVPHSAPPLTFARIFSLLTKALMHPIQALISSVSFALVWMQGDPAAPLWAFIDDYAFPERIDPLARPAGRSADDYSQAKQQPGSVVDIARAAVRNIPNGLRGIAGEFFMEFSIPRAHLDSSVVSYPKATNTEAAFVSGRATKKLDGEKLDEIQEEEYEQRSVDSDSDELERQSSRDTVDMQFCLAPATELPSTFVARIHPTPSPDHLPPGRSHLHRATTYVPRVDPQTGKIVAMLYQASSAELPHGTRTNRKYTDFAQPNQSYVKGVLDSTQFSYLHPGLYGDLPSLWLPVQNLRKRKELKRTGRQRLRDAKEALESAIEDNFLGKQAVGKIHQTSQAIRQRIANTRSAQRQPQQGMVARSFSQMDVQRKMEDMSVEKSCSRWGIDPKVIRRWDPNGFHDSCKRMQLENDIAVSSVNSTALETDEDLGSLDQMSASESDNSDTESSVAMRAVEEGGAGQNHSA
ncbi:hypothetical protein H4R99_000650 [Coemansia sp. RSA 1722]|nr:hypothetical protein LPJ57_001800 [Coemansia sp. RSA 486]KAJ2237928.1 hypothetical protein IWW45_000533 [Coemansia sp. RSA 485]KAJ2606097.1 hypothetical protein H4R99_000650 [Coemansia sp. RSA 1722]KAJ2638126.1 hypothetical protein GGF40_001882 [Coemansia sp. RSA 1286]